MSIGLRIVLIVMSVGTFVYVIRKIRKAQVRIVDMSFWMLFSLAMIILALFPEIAGCMSGLIGILSSVNFVFLAVIFALLLEIFSLSIKVSRLENKIIDLSGAIALKGLEDKERRTDCETVNFM